MAYNIQKSNSIRNSLGTKQYTSVLLFFYPLALLLNAAKFITYCLIFQLTGRYISVLQILFLNIQISDNRFIIQENLNSFLI